MFVAISKLTAPCLSVSSAFFDGSEVDDRESVVTKFIFGADELSGNDVVDAVVTSGVDAVATTGVSTDDDGDDDILLSTGAAEVDLLEFPVSVTSGKNDAILGIVAVFEVVEEEEEE